MLIAHVFSATPSTLFSLGLLCLLPLPAIALPPGSLIISELMPNPAGIADSAGEWIELYNPGAAILDLRGVQVSRDGDPDVHTIAGASPIPLGTAEFFVLGVNADPAQNGGVIVDQEYNAFVLVNGGAVIRLADSQGELLSAVYSFSTEGVSLEIFSVDESFTAGYANSLGIPYGTNGNVGTPGAPNSIDIPPIPMPPVPAPVSWTTRALIVGSALGLVAWGQHAWTARERSGRTI